MNIFGDFYNRAISYRQSKKEQTVIASEDWAAAALSGSSDAINLEDPISRRFVPVYLFAVIVIGGLLSWQLFNLQIANGQRNQSLAEGNRVREFTIRAPRGAIYDNAGKLLARNQANFDLTINPSLLPPDETKRTEVYKTVAKILAIPVDEVKKKAEASGLYYTQPVLVAENINREQTLSFDEKGPLLQGVDVDVNPTREYLDGGSLSHFLGYIGRISAEEYKRNPDYLPTAYIGKSGLESYYEKELKGVDGKERVEVDATGRRLKSLAAYPAQPGNNLMLSIDGDLQKKMAQYLKEGVERAGSNRGVSIALNPQNGQVLGAVNYPTYDNNLFAKGISQTDYSKLLSDPNNPLFNRVLGGSYPIGSTIKPFISSAALQEGVISASTTIDDKGKIDVPNIYNPSVVYTFKGYDSKALGLVNVIRAISLSSDVFYYIVGGGFQGFKGLGIDRLVDYYKKFGLGKRTGVDLADESAGYLPTPDSKEAKTGEPWYVGDTYNMSIGQGDMRITPLQLAVALGTVANGGTVYVPHFAKSIVDNSGKVVQEIKPEVAGKGFISPENIRTVQVGMEKVVEEGTGCCLIKAEVSVKVAAKTGTAETSSEGFDGKNPRTKPHAWFIAYAPADKPQIAIVTLVENAGEGALFAAPVTRNILKWYFGGRP
ncbi:penicillin-binding protein 2 [bacterium]|nr:penicillin-binding protein 2 [bacterium]